MESPVNTAVIVILLVFFTALAVQFFYYLYFYLAVHGKRTEPADSGQPEAYPPVSVVICARNEAENLEKYLPLVLEQNYPDFEVIVVNDCSEDESEFVLKRLKERYERLRVTRIVKDEKFSHGKKLALTVGIKAAKNEWLLHIDADCWPESADWIATMASHFNEEGRALVLGYGGFAAGKGILNNLIRFDAAFIALQYLSFALRGIPYMGVGRNLAYRKSVYEANKGFSSHHHLRSGDDDLFVNQVANKTNTTAEYRKESHTRTEAKRRFRDWTVQKKRHLTTGSSYRLNHRFLVTGEPFSRMVFYAMFVVLLLLHADPKIIVPAFLLRTATQLIVFNLGFRHLNEKYLLLSSLVFDILLPFYYLGLIVSNTFNRKGAQWRSGQIYPKKRSRIIN